MAAYRGCIEHFYRIYRPLEAMLTSFVEWPRIGISLSYRLQTGNLASDLEALGSHPPRLKDLPASFLPALPTFAHSLGALYVLQGSTLGSQHILHHLTQVLGENIAGANTFFRGHGPLVPKLWTEFRASLDAYGVEHPKQTDDVIGGANATFKAINEWMQA
jgi:heme oxygenase